MGRRYYWLDIFSVNQHAAMAAQQPPEWWAGTFAKAIAEIGTLLLVAAPWERPIPLTRAWCLWEVYSAIAGKCTVHLEAPPIEVTRLETAVAQSASFHPILDSRAAVAMERSECTYPEDRDRIFTEVRRSELGFDGVNAAVRGRLLGQLLCLAAHKGETGGALACVAAGAAAVLGSVPSPSTPLPRLPGAPPPPLSTTADAPGSADLKKKKKALLSVFARRKEAAAAEAAAAAAAAGGYSPRWRAGAVAVAVRLACTKSTQSKARTLCAERLIAAIAADAAASAPSAGEHGDTAAAAASAAPSQPAGGARGLLELSDKDGMRALHWACAGDGHSAVPLACQLVRAGASLAAGRQRDGATPLALLPAGSPQLTLAKTIADTPHLPKEVRAAASAFLAETKRKGRPKAGALAAALLPSLAREAVAQGIRIGNTSSELTDRRLACRAYVRTEGGTPLAAFVQKVTYTILRGSEESGCTEALVPRLEPPFDWVSVWSVL